jgi:hypothetical protein
LPAGVTAAATTPRGIRRAKRTGISQPVPERPGRKAVTSPEGRPSCLIWAGRDRCSLALLLVRYGRAVAHADSESQLVLLLTGGARGRAARRCWDGARRTPAGTPRPSTPHPCRARRRCRPATRPGTRLPGQVLLAVALSLVAAPAFADGRGWAGQQPRVPGPPATATAGRRLRQVATKGRRPFGPFLAGARAPRLASAGLLFR